MEPRAMRIKFVPDAAALWPFGVGETRDELRTPLFARNETSQITPATYLERDYLA